MLVPVGPENLTLRRVPVVTLGLMIFSLLFSIVATFGYDYTDYVKGIYAYHAHNAWTDIDPRLAELIELDADIDAVPRLPLSEREAAVANYRVKHQESLDAQVMALDLMDGKLFVRFGFKPMDPGLFSLVLCSFAYHGLFHMLPILFVFYMVGPYLEDRWGRIFFPIFFCAGGMITALAHMVLQPDSWSPYFGGSGAVLAVVGAFMVRYRHERIRFVYLMVILKRQTTGPAMVLFFIWLVLMVPVVAMWRGATLYPFVGWLPHLAALGFGCGVAFLLEVLQLEQKLYQSPFEKLPEVERFAITADRLFNDGAVEDLYAHLAMAWKAYPSNIDFTQRFWNQAVRMSRMDEAMGAGKKLVDVFLEEGNYDQAHFHWREISRSAKGDNLSPAKLETLVYGLLSVGHVLAAREVMSYTGERWPRGLSDEATLSLLEAARSVDPKLALSLLERLLLQSNENKGLLMSLLALRDEILSFHPDAQEPVEERPTIQLSAMPDRPVDMEDDPFAPAHISSLKVFKARPLALEEWGLKVQIQGQQDVRPLRFEQIKGIAAAAIRPIGDKPFLVLDLLTDHPFEPKAQHRVVRFSGPSFDPLKLVEAEGPARAAKALIERVMDRSEAHALPDEESLLGRRFPTFATLEEFQDRVYGIA